MRRGQFYYITHAIRTKEVREAFAPLWTNRGLRMDCDRTCYGVWNLCDSSCWELDAYVLVMRRQMTPQS
jgi:hypothetical protein